MGSASGGAHGQSVQLRGQHQGAPKGEQSWEALGPKVQLGHPCDPLLLLPHLGIRWQGQQQPQEEEGGATHPQEVEMSRWCHGESLQGERS